jgi:glycosyltransferase involved in cell wall biosynthesis
MEASITILLSVYEKDSPIYLEECLESIHLQDDKPESVLIVIEGLINTSLQYVINKWERIFRNLDILHVPKQINKFKFGLPFCLNKGIDFIQTNYICKMDSDDICYPNRIKVQREFIIQNPEVDICSSFVDEFDDNSNSIKRVKKVPITHLEILKYARFRNPINGPSMIFKKKAAIAIGGFPEVGSNEDYCFIAKFIMKGYTTANINQSLIKMRAGSNLVSRRMGERYLNGELEALKFIYKTGMFNTWQFIAHYVGKSIIRRLPFKFNQLLYTSILRSQSINGSN